MAWLAANALQKAPSNMLSWKPQQRPPAQHKGAQLNIIGDATLYYRERLCLAEQIRQPSVGQNLARQLPLGLGSGTLGGEERGLRIQQPDNREQRNRGKELHSIAGGRDPPHKTP
jgi:hypothetical protein